MQIIFSSLAANENSVLNFIDSNEQFKQVPTIANDAYEYLAKPIMPHTTRFIFVRHGESTSNKEKTVAENAQYRSY